VRHRMGGKAPRDMGWATGSKKAAYNRVYNRTSVSADRLLKKGMGRRRRRGVGGCGGLLVVIIVLVIVGML